MADQMLGARVTDPSKEIYVSASTLFIVALFTPFVIFIVLLLLSCRHYSNKNKRDAKRAAKRKADEEAARIKDEESSIGSLRDKPELDARGSVGIIYYELEQPPIPEKDGAVIIEMPCGVEGFNEIDGAAQCELEGCGVPEMKAK